MQYSYRIRINTERQFQVVQLAHWAAYGDAWLCAHDVFHHHPADDGSMQCEAMSFGAELWIGFPGVGLEAISAVSFAGATTAVYEHRPDLRRLILRREPPAAEPLDAYLADRLRELVDTGLAVVARNVAGHRQASGLRPASATAMAALSSVLNRSRYVQWMAYGYRRAERRFPAARKAQRLVDSFQQFLQGIALGSRVIITVDIDESATSFRLRG